MSEPEEDDGGPGPRRPVSPVTIVIVFGMIAALLYPFFQLALGPEAVRPLAGKAFGFVVVVMGAAAVFEIYRALSRRRPR